MSKIRALLFSGAVLAGLAACVQAPPGHPAGMARFSNAEYDVAMVYPASLRVSRGFESRYFLSKRWNPDAAQGVPGAGLLTLTLPKSNRIATAELRLGASDNSAAVQHCALPGDGAASPVSHVVIAGVVFKERQIHNVGMSKLQVRRAYRGVAHGNCYAIDLIFDWTDPNVYPGNPKPPMTQQTAFKRLTALLDGLTFARS